MCWWILTPPTSPYLIFLTSTTSFLTSTSPPYLNYILTPYIFTHLSDFSANEGVMMLINLAPGRLGTLSYYIPVLLLDDDEGGDDDAEV
jgi:hypothetical protein